MNYNGLGDFLHYTPIQNQCLSRYRNEGQYLVYCMTKHSQPRHKTQLLWATDIHLDRADQQAKSRFFDKLAGTHYDAVLLTGDISTADSLPTHLAQLSRACWPKPIYLLLGNHDYFNSTIAEVDLKVEAICRCHRNLIPLGRGEIIRLTPNTSLIGHSGWYDGRAGYGRRTFVDTPDRHFIGELKGLPRDAMFDKFLQLGRESADYFRRTLTCALRQRPRTILLGTHVPPFTQAIRHGGLPCKWHLLPYYANSSAGFAIAGISKQFPNSKIIVHSGHTHSPAHVRLSDNLEIRVGGAQPGHPALQGVFEIE